MRRADFSSINLLDYKPLGAYILDASEAAKELYKKLRCFKCSSFKTTEAHITSKLSATRYQAERQLHTYWAPHNGTYWGLYLKNSLFLLQLHLNNTVEILVEPCSEDNVDEIIQFTHSLLFT